MIANEIYHTMYHNMYCRFWMTPSPLLKKLVMGSSSMHCSSRDQSITDAIEFMSEKLDALSQQELASRLTLNCLNCYVEPQRLHKLDITLMDVSIGPHWIRLTSSDSVDNAVVRRCSTRALLVRRSEKSSTSYTRAQRGHTSRTGATFPT